MFTETRKKIVLPALASVFFKNKEMELHVRKKIFCFNLNKYFLLSIFFFKKKKKQSWLESTFAAFTSLYEELLNICGEIFDLQTARSRDQVAS